MAKRVQSKRWATLARLVAVQALIMVAVLLTSAPPASAQWFDGGFGNFWGNSWGHQRRSYRPRRTYRYRNYYPHQDRRYQQPEVDYSKAPAPKKTETPPQTNVLVVGDSMADWLAYGLELSFTESPEMGVVRRDRINSGLNPQEVRNDPRGEHPDWPKALPQILAADKPDYVIMMIGTNDRRPIRETRPPRATVVKPPGQQPGAEGAQPQAADNAAADPKKAEAAAAAKKAQESHAKPTRGALYDFRSEKWVELYIKRIDETIAAMKKQGVPVFWVGLPPVRGSRSMADFSFLNDLFRSRADKAGIVYVDIWDGFVDDAGRFSYYGPDVEGQNRRLRSPDGVHFTEAGARKLAHFVERELQRWMTARAAPVALPVDEPTTKAETTEKPPGAPPGVARPLAGPVISLSGVRSSEDEDALAGGGKSKPQPAIVDAVATKVLVKGDAVPAPAGRADDFSWPRRDVAPVGSDPTVAVATLPMTPMKAEQRRAATEAPAEATPGAGAPAQQPNGAARPRVVTRQTPRQSGGWFFGNWGWQRQQQQQRRPSRQRAQQPGFFPFLFRR